VANNLLSAALDNHIHQGNELGIDLRRVSWSRVVDMNDRALRDIVVGMGGGLDAPEFDASELLANGVPPKEVNRLRETFDEIEAERIAIMQQALREGWLDKQRYRDEMVELELATREAIGDDRYDALLYATGEKNRVKIRVVLENSSDRSFGFEAGDVVLMYDGRIIFRPPELREVSRLGEPGEWVTVDVLRNGEVVHLSGERGPISARLQPTRLPPDAFW
jgi:hypothetical protein